MAYIHSKNTTYPIELKRSFTPDVLRRVKDDLKKETNGVSGRNLLDIASGFLPILGLLKSETSFQGYHYYRSGLKLLSFFEEFTRENIDQAKLDETIEEIQNMNEESFFETMMDTIDRIDNANKAALLANILRHTINGEIPRDNFLRHSWILTNVPYIDLQQLHKYTVDYYQPSSTEILAANGLVNETVIEEEEYDENGNGNGAGSKYGLSPLGEEMLHYGLYNLNWQYVGNGRKVPGLTWGEG